MNIGDLNATKIKLQQPHRDSTATATQPYSNHTTQHRNSTATAQHSTAFS